MNRLIVLSFLQTVVLTTSMWLAQKTGIDVFIALMLLIITAATFATYWLTIDEERQRRKHKP